VNQYDPNQPPQGQQPPPQYQQEPPPGYRLTPPAASPLDQLMEQIKQLNVGIIAAAALFAMLCVIGACVVVIGLVGGGRIPAPSAPRTPTRAALPVGTPQLVVTPIPAVPTFNSALAGTYLNPYFNGRLDTMTTLLIDVLNPQTGQVERKAQLLGTNLDTFVVAFNIAGEVLAPDPTCPERVRLTAIRADNSQVSFVVCLKNAIILRTADIPELGGGDLRMGPYFIDILAPYLPAEYRQLLGIS
jgi:hypothetical protein